MKKIQGISKINGLIRRAIATKKLIIKIDAFFLWSILVIYYNLDKMKMQVKNHFTKAIQFFLEKH